MQLDVVVRAMLGLRRSTDHAAVSRGLGGSFDEAKADSLKVA
jgi:hypothetical protein